MKVVILAGGYGTRISEESHTRPKPMIEIGGKPIIWHIMKIYSSYGYNDFIICCGYKGYVIKEYFSNYFLHNSDVTFDFEKNKMEIHNQFSEPWKVTLIDTGLETMTGGRLKRVEKYVGDDTFMLTYGDGVSDVNISELVKFHKAHNKIGTVTSVAPIERFGLLKIDNDNGVSGFQEKPKMVDGGINAGFFVFEPSIFKYIDNDQSILEKEPLENLAKDHQLSAYKHEGFWQPMDTLRDKIKLEEMWESENCDWRKW